LVGNLCPQTGGFSTACPFGARVSSEITASMARRLLLCFLEILAISSASLSVAQGSSWILEGDVDGTNQSPSEMMQLMLVIVPATFVAGIIFCVCLRAICRYTRHRRLRRNALLKRDEWMVGKDLQKGITNNRMFIEGTFVGTEPLEEVVLDGEWFPIGDPDERTWLCCGSRWANDLAVRQLSWTELHARWPDVQRDRAVNDCV